MKAWVEGASRIAGQAGLCTHTEMLHVLAPNLDQIEALDTQQVVKEEQPDADQVA